MALRSPAWSPAHEVMNVLRNLRRASPRLAEAVAAHAELRWAELSKAPRLRS